MVGKLSYVEGGGILKTLPTAEITIKEALDIVSSDKYKSVIEEIRKVGDGDERGKLKKKLDYFMFGGTFTKRGNKNLKEGSSIALFDLDHVEDSIKDELSKDEYVHFIFRSPSGDGFKVGVKIPVVKDDAEYKTYWKGISKHFSLKENDEATKDISRACFVSWDNDIYYNEDSKEFVDIVEEVLTEIKEVYVEGVGIVENEVEDEFIKSVKGKWYKGSKNRQNLAMSLAGYLRKDKRLGLNSALSIIEGIARDCNDEDVSERLSAVRSTYAKDERDIKGISGLKELDVKVKAFDIEDYLISKGKNTKTNREEFKVNVDKVAEYIIKENSIKTWFGKNNDYSFNFDGKIMSQGSRAIVKIMSQELLESYCSRNTTAEIFEKVKTKSEIDREDFEKDDTNLIPLSNGVWDLENKKLLSHSPDYNFRTISPVSYDKNAECPNWIRFITETLYPEDVIVMQEVFGFNLYREYFIKKGVICEGEQDTGKSVLLDTLIKLVGEKNKTGLSLQKITSGSDFTKLSLRDKWSNVYDDLSSKDLSDGGAFKVATGGGYISGEEKFGEYQQFRSYAKQMFATNKIPPVKDNDDLAYFGRWIVFKFDNVPDKLDPFLRKKLWTEEELSGILNWALEGLYRLLDNGKFSYNKTPQEIKDIMEKSGCPLVAFSSDVLEREDGAVISKEDMFKIYTIWCDKNNRPRLSKEMLGRQLTKYCSYILSEKQKERIWKNARITQEYRDLLNKEENTDTSDTLKNNTRNILDKGNTIDSYIMKVGDKVSEVSASDKQQNKQKEKKVSEVSEEEKQNQQEIDKLLEDLE